MFATSIREFVRAGQRFPSMFGSCKVYVDYMCRQQDLAVSVSTGRRYPVPRYRLPSSMLGRLIVAFSGAAARRRRACARLNTFVVCDQTEQQEEFFQHIALTKFEKVYRLSNKRQRQEMLRNLTPQAWEAVHAGWEVILTEQEAAPAPPLPLT